MTGLDIWASLLSTGVICTFYTTVVSGPDTRGVSLHPPPASQAQSCLGLGFLLCQARDLKSSEPRSIRARSFASSSLRYLGPRLQAALLLHDSATSLALAELPARPLNRPSANPAGRSCSSRGALIGQACVGAE